MEESWGTRNEGILWDLHCFFHSEIPSHSLAWSQKWPFGFPSILDIMTRARSEFLTKYLHCNDITNNPPWRTPGHDKLCHIRPILDDILQKCTNNYNPHREQSIDEGMIAYKGRLSFKQYLPAKPTKLGIKIWERALPQNGYCHEFQIYTGKVAGGATEEGLGAIVVQNLRRKIIKKGHHVHMDNFFSPRFFTDLYAGEVYCCGTVRGNRKCMLEGIKSCKLKNHDEIIKFFRKMSSSLRHGGTKKLCLICQQTRIRMITSVFCVNKKMGQWRMFPVQLLVGSITDSCLELTELTNYECSKSKKWCRYLLWFLVDLAVVNDSIYLDGALFRGWGGDTYVQVEHHNIER